MDWYNVASVIFGLVAGIAAVVPFLLKAKELTKELGELFTTVSEALEDSTLTKSEILVILKEAKDILEVFKKDE